MRTTLCILLCCVLAVLGQSLVSEPSTASHLATFYARYGGRASFPSGTADAIEAYLYGMDDFMAGRIASAKARVDAIFSRLQSQGVWAVLQNPNTKLPFHAGQPPAYSSLRMLKQVVDFASTGQANYNTTARRRQRFTIAIAVAMCGAGSRATNVEYTQFEQINVRIDSRLRANNYGAIRNSIKVFQAYLWAITRGSFVVDLVIREMPECVKLSHQAGTNFMGVLGEDMWGYMAKNVNPRTEDADMVIFTYPSNRPRGQIFTDKKVGLITGGAIGGQRAVFISGDDLSFVERAPSWGSGEWTEVERRTYLPQWYQHESFHILFGRFPQFKLEVNGHDWFNKANWPTDFNGGPANAFLESDYFAAAVNQRFIPLLNPPLGVALLTALPTSQFLTSNWARISPNLAGSYARTPVQNGWHQTTISRTGTNTWVWKNAAGASINLEWNGQALTAPAGIYPFQILTLRFVRNSLGFYDTNTVASLTFNGEIFSRTSSNSQAVIETTPDTYSSAQSDLSMLQTPGIIIAVLLAVVCVALLVVVALFTWRNYGGKVVERP